jgi:hypothetical protein
MFFVIIFISALLFPIQSFAGEPLWPLDMPTKYLTSNFMEFREGRFHAGLDLKTDSHIGIPVIAVESGWISRLKTAPNGYGKVMYLTSDSGVTYVYAHLHRIADQFQPVIKEARDNADSYSISLRFPKNKFRVKAGQILALSGQSGTSGPHLHFEVRDQSQNPMNPELHGFQLNDTIAPVIKSITVMPVTSETVIDGAKQAHTVSGISLSGDLGEISAVGGVAFTAKIIEKTDVKGHLLEPFKIEVKLDGKSVYLAENRKFSFNDMPYMKLEWLNQPDRKDRWLFRRKGNLIGGRHGGSWSENITPGSHKVELIASDASGNVSKVFWTVVSNNSESETGSRWLKDSVRVELPNGAGQLSPFLTYNNKGETIVAPKEMLLFPGAQPGEPVEGLMFVGEPLILSSADYKNLKPQLVKTNWQIIKNSAVYRLGKQGKWGFVAEPTVDNKVVIFYASKPGIYALCKDSLAPVISLVDKVVELRPASNVKGITYPKWDDLMISVADNESGIDVGSIAVTLDDKRLIVEPDMPRHRLIVTLPDATPQGNHILKVSISDKSGLSATENWKILAKTLLDVD